MAQYSKSFYDAGSNASLLPLVFSATQSVLGLASGMLVGFSLGLVGGGGSILAVPLMVYVVGVPIATCGWGTPTT